MYQAVLFDLDDTLYDLRAYWTGRLERAFAGLAPRYPQLDRGTLIRRAIAEKVYMQQMPAFLRQIEVEDEVLIEQIHTQYCDGWFEELVLDVEAVHVFRRLQPHMRLGLVTNGPSFTQRAKIERFGLADAMDVIVVSGEVGIAKPDPAIFQIALEQLGTTPAQSLYVGDSIENDLYGAAAAGMPFVWINRRNEQFPDDAPLPIAMITHLAELPPLIEKQAL